MFRVAHCFVELASLEFRIALAIELDVQAVSTAIDVIDIGP